MAKTRQQKEEIVKDLTEAFSNAKSAVFVNYEGLSVAEIQEFRRQCRKQNLEYMVAKKTLLNLAMSQADLDDIDAKSLENAIGTIFSSEDEVLPAKTAYEFSKDHEALSLIAGLMPEYPKGERVLDVDAVKSLAKLPGKEELYGKIVGSLSSPISGFVTVLAGNVRGLVNTLNAIKEQKA